MITKLQLAATLFLSALAATAAQGQKHEEKSSMADCSMMKDAAAMEERGDKAMGFSHEKTTHHFILANDGGAIEVSANDATDQSSREQVRGHLGHIAKMFQEGNFKIPMLVHGSLPDGAAVMKQQKTRISYACEATEVGGRVRIRTSDPKALKAVHAFLRFQITEHHTGDPLEISGS